LFADAGNLLRVTTPRSTRGHGLVFAGRPADGLADADEALELARSLGSRDGEAGAQWIRAEALAACGRLDDASRAADAALSQAQWMGHRGWTAAGYRAVGVVRQTAGDLAGAEAAFRSSLQASENFRLMAAWAHARLGQVLVAMGRCDEAEKLIGEALRLKPVLSHYEARVARCELAVVRAEPEAAQLIDEAIERAGTGGHRQSMARLSALRQAG
jgi:tetratricopeptide (TPR) repeat protein